MMIRRITLVFAALVFTAFAVAASAFEAGLPRPLPVWEIRSPERPGILYCVGSIHVGRSNFYPLDRRYDELLARTDRFFFEIYKPDSQAAVRRWQQLGFYESKDPRTLKSEIGEKRFEAAEKQFLQLKGGGQGILVLLTKMKPWALWLLLQSHHPQGDPSLQIRFGYEAYFTRKVNGRPAESLESVDSQFLAIGRIDAREMNALIDELLEHPENAAAELNSILPLFENGDSSGVQKIMAEMKKNTPSMWRNMFAVRNAEIAEKLFDAMKRDEHIFVLVGAAHFFGEENILIQLEKKGCTVRRVLSAGRPAEKNAVDRVLEIAPLPAE